MIFTKDTFTLVLQEARDWKLSSIAGVTARFLLKYNISSFSPTQYMLCRAIRRCSDAFQHDQTASITGAS